MIQMISGCTYFNRRMIGPKDGPVELPEAVEQRLVAAGAAKYAAVNPAAPAGGDFPKERGIDPAPVETGAEAATAGVEAQNEPGEAALIVDEVNAENLTFAQLKAIAEQMGIETKGMRSKAALISAIENAKPPDLKVME